MAGEAAEPTDGRTDLSGVSPLHQAAIAALVAGVLSVGELRPESRLGLGDDDISRADFLLVTLKRNLHEPTERTERAALEILTENPWLLEEPDEFEPAHPCPLCFAPAIGQPWKHISVCDDCYPNSVCVHGRVVVGYNTSIGGGFEAAHVDDQSVCEQVTRDRRCWIDGRLCHMTEAKFGGVYIGVQTPGTAQMGL